MITTQITHISTEQVGGDFGNWWLYGGLFVRTFERSGVTYRELWKVEGFESEYADKPEVEEDDPAAQVFVYRASLPATDSLAEAHSDLDWVGDWTQILKSIGQVMTNFKHDYQLYEAVGDYYGWMNFDGQPYSYTRQEICDILKIEA